MTTQDRAAPLLEAMLVAGPLILASLVSKLLLHRSLPGTAASVLFALVPLPFFALSFVWLVRRALGSTELCRRIQLEALAFAFPVSMIFAITVELLHSAGVGLRFDLGELFIDMGLLYVLGLYLAQRRQRHAAS